MWTASLLGGALIGASASALLAIHGRVAGISGIVGGLLRPRADGAAWRGAFLAGLLGGGVLLAVLWPSAVSPRSATVSLPLLVVAGLLVGFGTQLGGGCTSGHGVCGISRFSPRSIVAVTIFIAAGALAVFAVRSLGLGSGR